MIGADRPPDRPPGRASRRRLAGRAAWPHWGRLSHGNRFELWSMSG